MDDILSSLGVFQQSEDNAVQDALREKILGSVRLNENPLLVPSVSQRSVPTLNAKSIVHLSQSVAREVKETGQECNGEVMYREHI